MLKMLVLKILMLKKSNKKKKHCNGKKSFIINEKSFWKG